MRKRRLEPARLTELLECESGAVLVEMTILIPVLLVLVFGGIEFARAIAHHHAIDKAVRSTARYIARLPSPDAFDGARARNHFECGAWSSTLPPASECTPVSFPGSLKTFSVGSVDRLGQTNLSVTAVVDYTFNLLSVAGLGPTLTFTVSHEQPYIGR